MNVYNKLLMQTFLETRPVSKQSSDVSQLVRARKNFFVSSNVSLKLAEK
jgi:hypothetical protein